MIITLLEPKNRYSLQSTRNLRQLTDNLIESISDTAARNDSFFVNDIQDDLDINTDSELVASILGGLMSTMAVHARNSCIQVSAKIYHDVILIHVKDCNSSYNDDTYYRLQGLRKLAENIGGFVDISSYRLNVTTVVFSFSNLAEQLFHNTIHRISFPRVA